MHSSGFQTQFILTCPNFRRWKSESKPATTTLWFRTSTASLQNSTRSGKNCASSMATSCTNSDFNRRILSCFLIGLPSPYEQHEDNFRYEVHTASFSRLCRKLSQITVRIIWVLSIYQPSRPSTWFPRAWGLSDLTRCWVGAALSNQCECDQ